MKRRRSVNAAEGALAGPRTASSSARAPRQRKALYGMMATKNRSTILPNEGKKKAERSPLQEGAPNFASDEKAVSKSTQASSEHIPKKSTDNRRTRARTEKSFTTAANSSRLRHPHNATLASSKNAPATQCDNAEQTAHITPVEARGASNLHGNTHSSGCLFVKSTTDNNDHCVHNERAAHEKLLYDVSSPASSPTVGALVGDADRISTDDEMFLKDDSSSDETESEEGDASPAVVSKRRRRSPSPGGSEDGVRGSDDGSCPEDGEGQLTEATRLPLRGGVAFDPSAMDIGMIKQRIEETLNALIQFRQFREQQSKSSSRSRKNSVGDTASTEDDQGTITRRTQLMTRLAADIVLYYQYSPELTEYLLQLFKPQEAYAFLEANEEPRPITLRTNTLKTKRRDLAAALIARGCNVDPLGEWTQVGLKVYDSTVPVGATPEYLAGHYMLQSAASLIPVIALAPQPGEKIVDMAAAPGGKSTYIAQILQNTGVLFANDAKRDRCSALTANLHRIGVTNCVVSCLDGRTLARVLPPVDRVLLDAPCSGSGIISRDPSIKIKRTPADFADHSKLQKQLLCAAVDAVNADSATGGYVVYSTCSVAVEENEEVIDYILKARRVKLVPFDLDIGVRGLSAFRGRHFHPAIPAYTRRFYPHVNNFDGFFVAKLKKLSNQKPQRIRKDRRRHNPFVKVWDKDKWTPEYTENLLEFPVTTRASAHTQTGASTKKPRKEEPVKSRNSCTDNNSVGTKRAKEGVRAKRRVHAQR